MAERIYLGALIDINKEQYLPIMNEVLTEINTFTPGTMQGIIQEFDTRSFIVYLSDIKKFRIFNSATLAVMDEITPARASVYGGTFALTKDRKKMYYIAIPVAGTHYLTVYDFVTKTETEYLIDLRGDTANVLNSMSKILLDDENEQSIYVYAPSLRRAQKISIQDSAVVATGPVFSSLNSIAESIDIGGGFLYVATGDSNYSYVSKIDKNTLQEIARSAQTYFRGTSTISHYGLRYKSGYIYNLTGISSGYSIAKVDAVTMGVIAKNEPGGATIAEGLFVTRDNRVFGAMGYGTTTTAMQEYDINTVALIKQLVSSITSGMTYGRSIFHHVESGRTLFGKETKMSQAERSYTIAGYKKLKEDTWR